MGKTKQPTKDESSGLPRTNARPMQARFAAIMEERTRLAREIHDTLLQGFTGVGLQLVAAASRVTGPSDAVAALRHVVELAQQTLVDARRAIWDLRAPERANGDLSARLRAAAEEAARGAGLTLRYEVVGRPRELHPDLDAVLGRVVQEAVANVAKHAAARTLRLSLSYRARDVRLTVVDDGRGFVVDPEFRSYGGHWGLLGMKERAIRIGANLRVTSAPGQGTELVLVVPRRVASRARSERPARA